MVIKRLTIAILFILTAAGLITIGVLNQLACEGQPIYNTLPPVQGQQIWGEQIISQSFIAPRDGLNRVDLSFQTYQRQNNHDVSLRVLEVPPDIDNPLQGTEVFGIIFNAATVSDKVWRTFTFPPIADSAGKTYLITLQSPTSVDGNAITISGIDRNVYAPGSVFLGPMPTSADITFRSCYQMTGLEKIQILSGQLIHNRPALWGNIVFYWLSLLAYALLLLGFFWKLRIED